MANRLYPIQLGAPGEDIGFRDLRNIIRRFNKLHQFKLASIRNVLNTSQREFLDALPLILDINHPGLPGYISATTPAGIYGYQPDARALNAVRQINRSFTFKPHRRTDASFNAAIDGVFLMGSVGSIAFTKASDIDIWLCHRDGLDSRALDDLAHKTQALENWAESLNLEVHFFLINSRHFQSGQKMPVSTDSSGETQHYLLLEEFYRTAVFIGGKPLAWWLVPPEFENDYSNYLKHLIDSRFIDENRILDLGGLEHVPAEEFMSATLWHIFKALYSPYKSLLKLSLLEYYASCYPQVYWLCTEIKRGIYQGMLPGPEMDPFLLLYRCLEGYLQQVQNFDRLAIVRQIFHLKLHQFVCDHQKQESLSLYEPYFRMLSDNWQDIRAFARKPVAAKRNDIKTQIAENNAIVGQLAHCHNEIIRFAHEHTEPNLYKNNDTLLLGRKLRAFFSTMPGKIEISATRSIPLTEFSGLTITENAESGGGSEWCLYLSSISADSSEDNAPSALYRRPTLIEMMAWMTVNRYYKPTSTLFIRAQTANFPSGEIESTLLCVNDFLNRHFNFSDSLENYEDENYLTHSLLIVNLGKNDDPKVTAKPLSFDPRGTPLSHGHLKECLIHSVDGISISRRLEVLTKHAENADSIIDCLIGVANETKSLESPNSLKIFCVTPGYAYTINRHIGKILNSLVELRSSETETPYRRYVLAVERRFCIITCQNSKIIRQWHPDENALISALSALRPGYGSVDFADGVLTESPLPLVYRHNQPDCVQCFVVTENEGSRIFVLDENGSLFTRFHRGVTLKPLAAEYRRLLYAVQAENPGMAAKFQFYELLKQASGGWSCQSIVQAESVSSGYILPGILADPHGAGARLQTILFLQAAEKNGWPRNS